jgi:putative Holliday junction resolvase
MRYLGVDPGGRRIGLAVGDDSTGVVSPLEVVAYDGVAAAAQLIVDATERIAAGCVVVGLPTLADGSIGPAARRSHLLAEHLRTLGAGSPRGVSRHPHADQQPQDLTFQ